MKDRRATYEKSQKIKLLDKEGDRHFFKNVWNYQSKEPPKPFDLRALFPGKSDLEIATELAVHFNTISQEFDPLEPSKIPTTYSNPPPMLQRFQVAG